MTKLLSYILFFLTFIYSSNFTFADADKLVQNESNLSKDSENHSTFYKSFEKRIDLSRTKPDSIPFAPPVHYPTERYPVSLFCADLDGDLDLDIAVATWPYQSSENISVLKNLGDGIFSDPTNYTSGNLPYSVFCADLDGDLDLDIITANIWSSNVSVLKNNGDGTFQQPINYDAGEGPHSVFCADLDDDNDLDLALANESSDDVSVLKNQGDGTFQPPESYPAGTIPTSLFCGDLDADQDLDLVTANLGSNDVSILKNLGDGTFQAKTDYQAGSGPISVFCSDLDGDLDLDLAVANWGCDSVSVLKNHGDGTFQAPQSYQVEQDPYSVFCADLDADGDFELAVANWESDNLSVFKNAGDGTFPEKVNYIAGENPHSVFCADLDGDKDLDLAMPNEQGSDVTILLNLLNSRPQPYFLLFPKDQDTSSNPVDLDWEDAPESDSGDTVFYTLFVSESNVFHPDSTIIKDSLLESQYQDTMPVGLYYWKVKAEDSWGAERWSQQSWSFHVFSYPASFSLLSPQDLDSVSLPVNFDWEDSSDPDPQDTVSYALLLSKSEVFHPESTTIYDSLSQSQYTGITSTGSHYWKVKATDRWGGVRWSDQSRSLFVFLCGDVDDDEQINLSDVIYLSNYFLRGEEPPPDPLCRANANGDDSIDLSDVVYIANYILKNGPSPHDCENY